MATYLYLVSGVLAGLGLGIGGYFLFRFLRRRRLGDSLGISLFLIKIPKEIPAAGSQQKDFKQEINLTEQLLSGLASFKKPFVLELAVPHIGEEIHFYLAVPRVLSEIAIKQIQGLWASASV